MTDFRITERRQHALNYRHFPVTLPSWTSIYSTVVHVSRRT